MTALTDEFTMTAGELKMWLADKDDSARIVATLVTDDDGSVSAPLIGWTYAHDPDDESQRIVVLTGDTNDV